MKKKLLSFSPYCGVWQHSFPEVVTLEHLRNEFDIIYIGCNGILGELCVNMKAKRADYTTPQMNKDKICEACINKRKIFENYCNYDFIMLDNLISNKELYEISEILEQTTKYNFHEIELDNIKIGKIAMYDIILKYKKNDFILKKENEWIEYRINLKNSLITYYALSNFYKYNQPNVVLVYNSLYPTNNVCAQLSDIYNISIYNLDPGFGWHNRMHKIALVKNNIPEYISQMKQDWNKFKNQSIKKNDIEKITNHFKSAFDSRLVHNYSPPISKSFDFYSFYPYAKNKKIFLATLSSLDECNAYEYALNKSLYKANLFETQIDWIKFLIKYFSEITSYYLIIRVHPREFPNKREHRLSDNAIILKNIFNDLPSNISVNWPDENISIYDLAQEVDVLLNSSSNAGLDFLFFGLPVVVYDENIIDFPIDLCYHGSTIESYLIAMNNALNNYWSFDRIYLLYKWINLYINISVYDISCSTKYIDHQLDINDQEQLKIDPNYLFKRDMENICIDQQERRYMVEQINSKLNNRSNVVDFVINDNKELIINEIKHIFANIIIKESKLFFAYKSFLKDKK